MDSQEFRNLQEAYMEVVENQQLDEVLDTPQKTYSYAKKMLPSALKAALTGDRKTLNKRSKGAEMGMRKIEKRNQKEQADLYDIILSHLLDEGYADTQEAAEVIMVNMSEEWRNVILDALDEGYKPLPTDRIKNKARKLAKDTLSDVGTTFNPFKSSDEKEKAKDNMTKRQKRVDKMVDVLKKTK